MTNDDTLLAGFLDRSLSEDQLLELEARKASSPEFAHQFSNMLTLEGMLAKAAPSIAVPAHFLNAVENSVAAKVLVGGATSGGFLSGLSSAWSWFGGAALALVTAGAVYYYTQPAPQPVAAITPTASETPAVAEPEVVLPAPAAEVNAVQPSGTDAQPNQTPRGRNADATPNSNTINMNSEGSLSALVLAEKDFDAVVASGDHVKATLQAMTLGLAFRKNNNLARSEDYFAMAVEHARKAKLAEQEVKALGEQAVTTFSLGNETRARLLLNQAIQRGSQTGIDVSVWTQKLKDLR